MATRFQLKSTRDVWSQQGGNQVVKTWEGPGDEYDAFVGDEIPGGYVAREKEVMEDGWVRVSATYGNDLNGDPAEDGLVSRTWHRTSNHFQKPLTMHPNSVQMATAPTGATPQVRQSYSLWPQAILAGAQAFFRHLKAYLDGSVRVLKDHGAFYPAPPGPITAQTDPDWASKEALAQGLFILALRQDDPVFEVSEPCLKKVQIVTSASVLVASSVNVNRFHTYSALCAAEPTLPGAALVNAAGLSGLVWLKREPEVEQTSNGLFQLTQEWWGAVAFEPFIYGNLITT